MYRIAWAGLLLAGLVLIGCLPLGAQVRVIPKEAKGGEQQGEPWAEVPPTFRNLKIPDWPVPTDLKRWQEVDRARTRATLLQCLGEMPPRPDPRMVKVLSKEDHDDYLLERFEFHNGIDMVVPGILLIPKNRQGPAPAILGLHGHGSSKESICTDHKSSQLIGPDAGQAGLRRRCYRRLLQWRSRRPGPGWPQARQGSECPGAQPVQALSLAGPEPVGHDAT